MPSFDRLSRPAGQPAVRLFQPDVVEPLRPTNRLTPQLTVRQLWNLHYRPVYLASRDTAQLTVDEYVQTLDYWDRFSGEPALEAIDETHTLAFVAGLRQCRGRKLGSPMGVNTIRKHCRQLQAIVDLAGPRGPHNRRGLSLLVDVPYFEPPRGHKKVAEDAFEYSEAVEILRGCDVARLPVLEGLPAPAWWRGIFCQAAYLGLRIGTLLAWEFAWCQGEWLEVPATGVKGGDPKRFYMNVHARAVLDSLRAPPRRLVFPWPHDKGTLYDECARLIVAAGLPPHRQFRFHAFRKMFGTDVFELHPGVARMGLGHTTERMTRECYVAPRVQKKVLDQLPRIDDRRQRQLFEDLD